MKNEDREKIKLKIATTLNILLNKKKEKTNNGLNKEDIVNSYNEIALIADIRKATVSDTFNANTIPSSITLIEIIKAMGFGIQDFGNIYDSLTNNDLKKFTKEFF